MFNKHFKTSLLFIIVIALTLGLSISLQSLLAAWTAPLNNPTICTAGTPGCDEPVNKGSSAQIKGGPLYVNYDNVASTGFLVAYGKVGIGASSPNKMLHIYNANENAEIDLQTRTGVGNHFGIYTATSTTQTLDSLNFWASNTNILTLLRNGKVGIGTAAPAHKLSVAGIIQSTAGGIKFPDGTLQTTAVGNVQIVQGPISSCRGASIATCPAGYKVTGGGSEFAGTCGCAETERFVVYNKPVGTTGWMSTIECSYNYAYAVCMKQ